MKNHHVFVSSSMSVVLLMIPTGCSDSGRERGGGGGPISEGKLPWSGSFTQPAPDRESVAAMAADVGAEMQSRIPDATLQAMEEGVVGALSAGNSRQFNGQEPPFYDVLPETESDAYIMAGVGAVFQGSLTVGTWAFSQAVISDPDDPYALNQLGWALLADGRLDEARRILLRAVEIDPGLWTAWSSLGEIYERQNDPDRASYCYQQGLLAQPESLFLHLKLGALQLEQGDLNGAGLHAGVALAINPESGDAQDLQDRVEESGGAVTPVAPSRAGGTSSRAYSDVLQKIFDCEEEHTGWMMTAIVPTIQGAVREGYDHRDRGIELQHDQLECDQECARGSQDARDSCSHMCDMTYCSSMAGEITRHHQRMMSYLYTEMGFAAGYRARYRACAYEAIEDRIDELSASDARYLYEYVDWEVQLNEESNRTAPEQETLAYQDELGGMSSVCSTEELEEAVEEAAEEGAQPLVDVELEACADGFFCLSFGETSVGFDVGVGFASGGLTADYGTGDLIFALGVGADAGVAAVGVDAKLSIQRGIGLSPSFKFGGPIRASLSRDFWLFSF
ncbi:MAG: tetratricopeptide repeat protein [Planctomycetota bacterium]